MLELCILKVDDPGCFWGRIVKGAGVCVEDPKEYEELHIQMNLFYHKVNLDIEKMRLPSLEEGQSWCRAVLESLFQGADGCQALCFLVDHAKRISVNADKVLAPLEKFLQLPFWVRKFQLSGIHPMTLQVSDSLEKAELVPSSHWDTSATRYFRNLLQASTLMEAVLCDEQAESTAVELYLTIENMKSVQNGREKSEKTEAETALSAGDFNKAMERFRKFLNPLLDKFVSKFGEEPRMDVLIHSAIDIQPCNSLASAPLTEDVQKALSQWSYSRPGVTECYCWPMVARGCDTLIVSSNGDDPLSYLPPFLTHLTHLMLSSVYSTLTSHTGPIAVILCPGWKKSQHLSDMLEISAARSLNPLTILVGHRREEAKSVKIKNCQLLVTTPFSLVRLLVFHTFLFLRLCHLVLDEVDVLYTRAPEEMSTILQHFEKVAASEERTSMPRQIIAAGRRWSHHAETLLTEHMRDPCVIITAPEEAALYGKVHQIVLLCLDDTKISTLPLCLNFASDVAQKTLIITNSMDEVEQVFTAVSSRGLFAWKLHEKLIYQFDVIIDQWRKVNDPGTHIVLVTTNHCVKALDIQDATCIVHYGFPSTPKQFGQRLFYMSKNFGNLSDKDRAEKLSHSAKSVLLLSEYNASHINGILRYMERANAVIPHELQDFAKGVMQAKEKQKAQRPLCSHLKSFGFCRDCRVCPDRHTVDPVQDAPQHINSRTITILPLYIKNASCYYGRLVSGKKDGYNSLAAQMAEHYAIERLHATKVVEGGIYALQEEDVYHRVRVQAVMERGERLFYSVLVCFLDEGHQKEVKAHQLLILPSQFQILPPQAVEIIVCRVQPIDGEVDWNPKVSWHISQKIKGVQHQGKIVLCLGNTVWVDPMVRITSMPGLKTTINEYDIHSEILATGMGTNNPQHVVLLRELCQRADVEKIPCMMFHPLIKWFQREDSVTLTIKLVDPVGQTCEFFPHRVLYSGTVNDRHYHADLELHNGIIPEKSTWSMKCSTPVIKLMKAEKGFWKMLLKQ
ncbi:tudor domain-containing protein 12-like, partial [Scleropages formosus]